MEATPQPGTLLADRYRLVRPLARGGMGSVWRAEHLALSSEVAVKIIDPQVASADMGVPRFLREARALAALRSPHIVQVTDFGSDGDIVYLVMELLEGRTLAQRLKAEGKLSASETNRVLSQVCKAMSHAHERGIVHRDLKPDNIFLCDQSREHVTKVVDFGIAKALGGLAASNTGTEAGAFLGTPSYMSPEQCRGAKDIDHRSDLWALGAIAYECLLGKRLFEGDVIGDLVVRICTEALPVASNSDQLPAGFNVWLHKAMARGPGERFQSATELARALAAVLEAVGESASGVDSAETLQEERAPARPPVQAAGLGTTLANGSVVRSPPPSRRSERFPFRLAAGSLGIIALLVIVAFIRSGTPTRQQANGAAEREAGQAPPASPSSPPRVTTAATPALPPGVSSPVSGHRGGANEGAPDGGVVLADPRRKKLRQPVPVKVRSAREAPGTAPARPAKASVTPTDAPEMEVLRRKR